MREEHDVEDRREVCLEDEIAKRRLSGMATDEIAREMGVEAEWVEQVVSILPEDDPVEEPRS